MIIKSSFTAGIAATCFFCQFTFAAVVAGPDAHGYFAETTGYNLRDIESSGTKLAGDDDRVYQVPIGFDFSFNNLTMDNIGVSINGFLIQRIATSAFRIEGYFDDLVNYGPPLSGDIYYQTMGAAGSKEFIVGYYGVNQSPLGLLDIHMTFEIILHEGTNTIEYQYAELFDHNRVGKIGLSYFPFNPDDNLSISGAVGYHEHTGYLISQIPIPASIWIFGSGMLVLTLFARRKLHA